MTRKVEPVSFKMGEIDISCIKLNAQSRDDIPKILGGLQHIYTTPAVRDEIFRLRREGIAPGVAQNNGRPGMTLWSIFVLGVLRLDLNLDYDRLHELACQHRTIRQFLGFSQEDESAYHLQTLKDNVPLLTPELLSHINEIIVKAGHELIKKKSDKVLRGRCDSFVVKTTVHYPTDINLLYDATRKVIEGIATLYARHQETRWRQSVYNIKRVKRYFRWAQKSKRGGCGKTAEQKEKKQTQIKSAHHQYSQRCEDYVGKALSCLAALEHRSVFTLGDRGLAEEIRQFAHHAERQCEQIKRRVLKGEVIPHEEKVFSLFEPHTEWISKGKAGIPVELGLRVCILEDQYQFILHHRVMAQETDDKVAVLMVSETKSRLSALSTVSFDKGFHSPSNQVALKEQLAGVGLPHKGRLSQQVREYEQSEAYRQARHKHAAVESAIHALTVHGLDRCPDHGLEAFKRYVALAMVARNLHRIGDILHKKLCKKLERAKRRERRVTFKRAA